MDVRQDLSYGADWSRRTNWPIFKVKRSPEWSMDDLVIRISGVIFAKFFHERPSKPSLRSRLSMDVFVIQIFSVIFAENFHGRLSKPYLWSRLVTTDKPSHFQFRTIPGAGKALDVFHYLSYGAGWSQWGNWLIFKVKQSSERTLVMEPVGHDGNTGPFSRSNQPRNGLSPFSCAIIHGCFGDSDFWHYFYQNFSLTFVKTLAMESVGHNGQTDPFSRSNEPRNRFLASFLPKIFMDVRQDLSYRVDWFGRLKIFMDVHKDLSYGVVGHDGKTGPLTRSNDLRSGRLVTMGKQPIFNIKLTPELSQLVTTSKLAHFHGQAAPEQRHFCRNISWTSVKTLAMELIGHDLKTDPFSRSNDPRSGFLASFLPKFSWTSVKTLVMKPVGSNGKIGPFSRSNDPRSRMSIVTLAKEPLVTMSNPANFQGQSIPGAGESPVLPIFVFYIPRMFW
ncbi:hypothetical protein H5410_058952 [Solanum commersonii]|uniref:Uncharacterized protein n=1 Tax=Solanum commersonii TaxID=4109 RepID=A0A9J5W174_SOLCO|nr:hypothetical protein H5410_058952 [Solanum commersonii]